MRLIKPKTSTTFTVSGNVMDVAFKYEELRAIRVAV